MKKLFILVVMTFCAICFSACNQKDSQTNEHQKTESIKNSHDFDLLKAEILNLNDTRLSQETKIPRWLRWLCVGISDAVGGLVGAQFGVVGGIILGSTASIEAYIQFTNYCSSNGLQANGINDICSAEETFCLYALQTGHINDGLTDGYYHNTVIRNLYEKHGEDLLLMDEYSLKEAVKAEAILLCTLNNEEQIDVMNSYNAADYVFNESIDYSPSAFINRIQTLNSDVALELSILEPVLTGINEIEDKLERVEYLKDVVEIIDESQIPEDSKRTIKSGASIALESSLLWNIE